MVQTSPWLLVLYKLQYDYVSSLVFQTNKQNILHFLFHHPYCWLFIKLFWRFIPENSKIQGTGSFLRWSRDAALHLGPLPPTWIGSGTYHCIGLHHACCPPHLSFLLALVPISSGFQLILLPRTPTGEQHFLLSIVNPHLLKASLLYKCFGNGFSFHGRLPLSCLRSTKSEYFSRCIIRVISDTLDRFCRSGLP